MDNIVIHIRKDLHSKIKLSPWSLKSGRPKPAARHPSGGDPGEFTQTTSSRHPKMTKKQISNLNIFRHNRNFWVPEPKAGGSLTHE